MSDPALDQAVHSLRAGGHIAMTIAELGAALEPVADDPAILERRLREDPRFVVLDRAVRLPGLDQWPADRRAAYAATFRTLDLAEPNLVLLASTDAAPLDGIARLLHTTVIRLVGTRAAPAAAAAAELARGVLAGVIPPGEAAPTTTLPPCPRRPTRGQRCLPPPGPTAPPVRGSRPESHGRRP